MGLLEKEIVELRGLLKKLDQGKITIEQLNARIAVYSQTERRAKLMLTAWAMAAKSGKILTRITKSNMIGDMAAIETNVDFETENILCPLKKNEIIIRQECLEISGKKENFDQCTLCENFSITRRLLLPEKTD